MQKTHIFLVCVQSSNKIKHEQVSKPFLVNEHSLFITFYTKTLIVIWLKKCMYISVLEFNYIYHTVHNIIIHHVYRIILYSSSHTIKYQLHI